MSSIKEEAKDENEHIVRIRGVPWSCSRDEIIKFFSGSKIKNSLDGIHFMLYRDGRPSGEAYIEFETAEDAEKAVKKNYNYIGTRYIEVFASSRVEMKKFMEKNAKPNNEEQERGPAPNADPESGPDDIFIRIRGLPWSCTVQEIEKFFEGIKIAPNGIKMPVDGNKRSIGEAYLQFATLKDADKAMTKHKEKIGYRYIEVFRSSAREYERVDNDIGPMGPPPFNRNGGGPRSNYYDMPPPPHMMDYHGPPPPDYPDWNRGPYGPNNGPPYPPHGGRFYDDYRQPPPSNWEKSGGPMRGNFHRQSRPDPYRFNRLREGGRAGGGNGNSGPRSMGGPDMPDPSSRGPPTNHFVFMRELPFRILESDIMNFFSDLVTPISVQIVFDDYGRPSGEAKVEFRSHQDAVKAMQKDRTYLFNSCVELFLCSKSDPSQPSYDGHNGSNNRNYGNQQGSGPPKTGPSNSYASSYSYNASSNDGGPNGNGMSYQSHPNPYLNNNSYNNNGAKMNENKYNGSHNSNGNSNPNGVPPNPNAASQPNWQSSQGGDARGYNYYGMTQPGWPGSSMTHQSQPAPQQPTSQQAPPPPPPQSSVQPMSQYGVYSYSNPYLTYSAGPPPQQAAAPAYYNPPPVSGYSYSSTANVPGGGHTIKKAPISY